MATPVCHYSPLVHDMIMGDRRVTERYIARRSDYKKFLSLLGTQTFDS